MKLKTYISHSRCKLFLWMKNPQTLLPRALSNIHTQPQKSCGYLTVWVLKLFVVALANTSCLNEAMSRVLAVIVPSFSIQFSSSQKGVYPDLLATSGDYLRVWRVDTETRIECLLNNVSSTLTLSTLMAYILHVTLFLLKEQELWFLCSSDIIWLEWGGSQSSWHLQHWYNMHCLGLGGEWSSGSNFLSTQSPVHSALCFQTGQVVGRVNLVSGHVKTQLIAHDKEVYDIAFSRAGGGRDMFASVGKAVILGSYT